MQGQSVVCKPSCSGTTTYSAFYFHCQKKAAYRYPNCVELYQHHQFLCLHTMNTIGMTLGQDTFLLHRFTELEVHEIYCKYDIYITDRALLHSIYIAAANHSSALIKASYSSMPMSASARSASLEADDRFCLHFSRPCRASCKHYGTSVRIM